MGKLTNDEKHYWRCRQNETHFRCNKSDMIPSKFATEKDGCFFGLIPPKYVPNDIIKGPHTTSGSMV